MKARELLMLLVMCLLLPFLGHTQVEPGDTTQLVSVATFDGKVRVGVILSDDGREILLQTPSLGNIYIKKENIESISLVEEEEVEEFDGDLRSTGPFTTRYYFTTNALPIKKREDYAMIHLYGPEVQFSVTDRFSVGVMSTWIASPLVVALKYTIPTKNPKVNFGLGTLAGTSGYLNTFRGYGALHWGMVTFGDRMRNITISAGYAYLNPGIRQNEDVPGVYPFVPDGFGGFSYPNIPREEINSSLIQSPALGIGGITKLGKNASFIVDAMFFYGQNEIVDQVFIDNYPNNITILDDSRTNTAFVMYLMPGMRFQKRADRAFQVALAGVTVIGDNNTFSFPAPMCSWFFKF